jgi:hypothetical protein
VTPHAVIAALALLLAGGGVAGAQVQENALPAGTFASTKNDCAKLATRTPAEIGDDMDFEVLTAKGLTGYRQTCDFLTVSARDAKTWVATAFCDESGYTYPDLFSIKLKDDGRLNVTRMSDLTQQGGYDASAQVEPSESDTAEQQGGSETEGAREPPANETLDEPAASESYSSFVKCDAVKP